MEDLEKLKKLEDGEECGINWSEGGGGLVTRSGDSYMLEYVPQYGGEPHTQGIYNKYEFAQIIDTANAWT